MTRPTTGQRPRPRSHPAPDPKRPSTRRETAPTGDGNHPAAFERAVCDAFSGLGYVATHVGGNAAPDGYIDAPLGLLGYRVMLEYKTATGVVTQPDAVKAPK
jgi:hypothetical protein